MLSALEFRKISKRQICEGCGIDQVIVPRRGPPNSYYKYIDGKMSTHAGIIWWNSRESTLLTPRYAHLSSKWSRRDSNPFLLIKPSKPFLPLNLPNLQRRSLEFIRKKSKTWYQRRPAPIVRFDVKYVNLECVTWFSRVDVDWAIHLVELGEFEGREWGYCGCASDLTVGGVEAVESNCVARRDVEDRRDASGGYWDVGAALVWTVFFLTYYPKLGEIVTSLQSGWTLCGTRTWRRERDSISPMDICTCLSTVHTVKVQVKSPTWRTFILTRLKYLSLSSSPCKYIRGS